MSSASKDAKRTNVNKPNQTKPKELKSHVKICIEKPYNKRLTKANSVTEQISNNSNQSDTNVDVVKNVEKIQSKLHFPRCIKFGTVCFSLERLEIHEKKFHGEKIQL